MVEQAAFNRLVVGSSPTGRTRIFPRICRHFCTNSRRNQGVRLSLITPVTLLGRLTESHPVASGVTGLYKPCANRRGGRVRSGRPKWDVARRVGRRGKQGGEPAD